MDNIKSHTFPSIQTLPKSLWPMLSICLLIIAIVFTSLYIIPPYIHASETGELIGAGAGKIVGKALGSYDGITSGIENGYESGKKEGLSAKDTVLHISSIIKGTGKLEVLSANVQINDFMSNGKKYAAVYMLRGSVVFSVDFAQASVITNEDGIISIVLPQPQATLTLKDEEVQTIKEMQRKHFNGSKEDGFDSYLNAVDQIINKGTSQISDYPYLLESAKKSAKTKIENLAENICGYKPDIAFKEV